MTFRIEPCKSWEEFMEFARGIGRRAITSKVQDKQRKLVQPPKTVDLVHQGLKLWTHRQQQKDDLQWDYDASPQSGMTNGEFNS